MRLPIGARSRDPIIMRFFEALKCPGPGFEGGRVGGVVERIWPVRVARCGFKHRVPRRGAGNQHSSSHAQNYKFVLSFADRWVLLRSRNARGIYDTIYDTKAQPTRKPPCVVR